MTMFLPGGATIIIHRYDYKRYRSTSEDLEDSGLCCEMPSGRDPRIFGPSYVCRGLQKGSGKELVQQWRSGRRLVGLGDLLRSILGDTYLQSG